jgi:phage virion morphogenesis protein
MSGAGLTYDLSGLDVLRRRVGDLGKIDRRGLLDLIGAKVESQTRRRITDGKEDPDGNEWPQWSDAYAAKRHGGHSLLEGEGLLLGSIGYAVALAGDRVEIGSNMIYAATHQFGDEKRNIPARPFLGLSRDDEAELDDAIDNFISRVLP